MSGSAETRVDLDLLMVALMDLAASDPEMHSLADALAAALGPDAWTPGCLPAG